MQLSPAAPDFPAFASVLAASEIFAVAFDGVADVVPVVADSIPTAGGLHAEGESTAAGFLLLP